jgi:hypothetical protein
MWESIISALEKLGAPAGWITAILQLLIWIIGAPIFYFRYRRRIRSLEQKVTKLGEVGEDLQKQLAEMKDLANRWFQMILAALSMMKVKAPKLYRDYVGSYGGEKNFKDMWVVPKISVEESELAEGEIEEKGGQH